jgi:hypothetical protein
MPHIVINGPVDLEAFFARYEPTVRQQPGEVLKLLDIFMDRDRRTLLIEALAAGGGPPVRFLVLVSSRDSRTTVRIYPGTDPEKTVGVKKILALVAADLKNMHPGCTYGSTNLPEMLL